LSFSKVGATIGGGVIEKFCCCACTDGARMARAIAAMRNDLTVIVTMILFLLKIK
jgi:hypothetical protein